MAAYTNKEDSLALKNPKLAKQWHSNKNEDLTPYDVTTGYGKKYGGYVKMGMSGKQLLMIDQRGAVAHIAQAIVYVMIIHCIN